MAEPDTRTLVLGAGLGVAIGLGAGLLGDDILLGVSLGFALAVVFVAGLVGREQS